MTSRCIQRCQKQNNIFALFGWFFLSLFLSYALVAKYSSMCVVRRRNFKKKKRGEYSISQKDNFGGPTIWQHTAKKTPTGGTEDVSQMIVLHQAWVRHSYYSRLKV